MIPYFYIFNITIPSFTIFLFLSYIISAFILQENFKKFTNDKLLFIKVLIPIYLLGVVFSSILYSLEQSFISGININLNNGKNVLGGFIFSVLYIALISKILNYNFYEMFKFIFPSMSIGYAIGRLGCLFAGDGCYGIKTDSFFGMKFPNGIIPTYEKVHPTPLYDCIFFLIFYIILQKNISKNYFKNSKILFSSFFLISSLERFIIEFIRRNDKIYYFSQAQWISIGLIIVSLLLLYKHNKNAK